MPQVRGAASKQIIVNGKQAIKAIDIKGKRKNRPSFHLGGL